MQIVDGYTYNTRIISPRTTGSWEADAYLIAGPSYKETPDKFDKDHIIRSSSRFTLVLGRTGVYGEEDVKNVRNIQKGYILTPLLDFLEGDTTTVASKLSGKSHDALLPIFPFINLDELAKDSPEPEIFFSYANFIIHYITIPDYELDIYKRFREINIGPGLAFNGQSMSKDTYRAIKLGVSAASAKIGFASLIEHFGNRADGWMAAIDPPIFGPEEVMKGRYLTRAFAAQVGLYGADPKEAYYPSSSGDIDGDDFDSTKHKYTLTFPVERLPSIQDGGFWSVTMYRLPERLFVHNPIDRYSIGDRTEGLVHDDKGGLTLYIQKDKPDTTDELANWLPAPDPDYGGYSSGLFSLSMRIYWPTEEDLSAPYLPPGVKKAGTALTSHI